MWINDEPNCSKSENSSIMDVIYVILLMLMFHLDVIVSCDSPSGLKLNFMVPFFSVNSLCTDLMFSCSFSYLFITQQKLRVVDHAEA